jgi:hypothetical protein
MQNFPKNWLEEPDEKVVKLERNSVEAIYKMKRAQTK